MPHAVEPREQEEFTRSTMVLEGCACCVDTLEMMEKMLIVVDKRRRTRLAELLAKYQLLWRQEEKIKMQA